MTRITDGTGSGNGMKVDGEFRAHAFAVTQSVENHANVEGDAYNVNTGYITLTDAADTPMIYLKNNETQDLIITAIAVGLGPSTSGTGIGPKITVVRNPTTGTIITSTPTDVGVNSNRNYGSNKTLTVDAYKGATGDTMTDGDDHLLILGSSPSRVFATINEVIPKGSSIGVKIDPPTSNTSMACYVAFICHLASANDSTT